MEIKPNMQVRYKQLLLKGNIIRAARVISTDEKNESALIRMEDGTRKTVPMKDLLPMVMRSAQ